MTKLPTFYIPHGGGPCFFIDSNPPDMWKKMEAFLRGLAATVSPAPKAVLVISSHWEEVEFTLGLNPAPPLIYDYSGFPEHTYRLQYPAPGSPELAQRAAGLLQDAGIKTRFNDARGFDHGVFIPFLLIYPEANIPIVQLSMKRGLDPAQHIAAGKALAKLRDEGVLIVGSGMSYHNMRGFSPAYTKSSEIFDSWLTASVCDFTGDARAERFAHWESAPEGRVAHPREEHLVSLFVAAGAAYEDKGTHVFGGNVLNVAVSGYRFG